MPLTLTRRESESLKIGEHITVKVCRTRGNQVVLSIDAPRSVAIVREELLLKKTQSDSTQ